MMRTGGNAPDFTLKDGDVIDKNGKIRHYQVQSLSLIRPEDDEVLEAIREAEENN